MSSPADRFRALVEAATPPIPMESEGLGAAALRAAAYARLIVALVKIAPALVEAIEAYNESDDSEGVILKRIMNAITRAVGEEK